MVLDNLEREKNFAQRLEFTRFYARWVRAVPNEVWSKQQAMLIDSLIENAKNLMLSAEEYLKLKRR